ncbi:MAG TPA: oxygenase MpaB family protein [Solirubrobacterales bacterium]
MPREVAPQSHREFRAWFEGMLDSDEMHLTPNAHEMGYATAFEIPMPAYRAPAKAVHHLIMLGSLPARVRELCGVDYRRRQQRVFRAVVRSLRGARPLTPRSIREGYNTGHFRMVARRERRRLRCGERTPQVAA